MRPRVSNAEFSREAATDGFDHVELRSSVVVIIAGGRLEQRLVQRDDGHIRDEDLAELLKPALKTIVLIFEVLKPLEDLAEEITESRPEPLVEGGVIERAAEGVDVLLTEFFERSVVLREEADSERPEQGVSLQFPASRWISPVARASSRSRVFGNVSTSRSSIAESGGSFIHFPPASQSASGWRSSTVSELA